MLGLTSAYSIGEVTCNLIQLMNQVQLIPEQVLEISSSEQGCAYQIHYKDRVIAILQLCKYMVDTYYEKLERPNSAYICKKIVTL